MEAPYVTIAIFPEPGDDHVFETVCDLLLERGARPDGENHFIERRRRMYVDRSPRFDLAGPVEIVMSAGALDDPDTTRRETAAFARYLTGLLVAVVERTRPMYGGIGIEACLPTPSELREGVSPQGFVTDPFFVRADLLGSPALKETLAGEFRRSIECRAGTVFASWWPFVDGKESTPGGLSIWQTWAGGRLLGRVAARHIRKSGQ
ncbi:hypothetical protein Q0Z83_022850 [Actinoplanes sichuanensis]|nr:hypothetical protein Q0Z83_022850 [Actinoplanes sichuanensis]